ncbi:hypothetical protein [Achromobacter sp. AGC39]
MSKMEALASALMGAIGANSEATGVERWIDTGVPQWNQMLGGEKDTGVPQGRLLEMFGPSSSGKTAIATHLMKQTQLAGGIAGFMDHERSFDIDMASGPRMGLDPNFPRFIYKRPRTWEESNTQIAQAASKIRESGAIAPEAPILFVFDSIASAIPASSAGKNMDELNMNDTTALARVTSTTLKTMALHAGDLNFTVLYLNQIRTKPGVVYGDPTTTPGGGAMEFYATFRIALGRTKIMEERTVGGKKEKVFAGQSIKMRTTKNKLTRPFQELSINMMFEDDGNAYFDLTGCLLDIACDLGKLEKSGAFIQWLDGKKYHRRPLIAHIDSDPAMQAELKSLCL